MINTLRRAAVLWALASIMLVGLKPAFPQAPSEAQRNAIRSECRSDYETHCASVPPGGAASLQCLQQNMSSLSSGCKSAVRAVEPPAAPKAEAAPAPASAKAEAPAAKPVNETAAPQATPKSAPVAAAKTPSTAQLAAVRSACRSDYQRVCAGVPTGGSAALQCLENSKSKVSASCQQAVNAIAGGATGAATAGAPATAAIAAPGAAPSAASAALQLRPMRPREELMILRSSCGGDVRALCGGIPAGGGRIVQCLATQAASLSTACKAVLAQFAAR